MTTAPLLIAPAPRSEPRSYVEPQPQRHLHLVPSPQLTIDDLMQQPAAGTDRRQGAASAGRSPLPAPDPLVRGFFLAVAEVLVGRRSVEQLGRNATLPVLQWLRSVRPRSGNAGPVPAPRVRAVHLCPVRDGVNESTAIIQHGPHIRAMNARFIGLDDRWQCVQLELV